MPSVEASQSRAEASRLPYIARPAALIVAIVLISWLIGLSDVGITSVLLGASTVVLMVSLLGFGYWRAMSRAEERAAVTGPQTGPLRAALMSRAARAERREALAALRLTQAREAVIHNFVVSHRAALEVFLQESERRHPERERDREQSAHENWAEIALSVEEAREEVEPPPRRRRMQRRPKEPLATKDRA
jgi:hypothetical protein